MGFVMLLPVCVCSGVRCVNTSCLRGSGDWSSLLYSSLRGIGTPMSPSSESYVSSPHRLYARIPASPAGFGNAAQAWTESGLNAEAVVPWRC
ncbi:hypothetical protein BD779DRAFT_1515958 [Infundibulicybe gibba]|nr:hypothetical protein BD779DRAFT_1515958 [Infundibulicybe gibba]